MQDTTNDAKERAIRDIIVRPVGLVHSDRTTPEDDRWDAVTCFIELDAAQFTPDALAGIDTFSHLQIVFVMDRVDPAKVEKTARHPRNNTEWPKVGIFAQRGKNRPNRIGETICRLDRVEGLRLHVTGLDAIAGTPVLDIKPWVREFGPRGEVRQPSWMDELMKDYWA